MGKREGTEKKRGKHVLGSGRGWGRWEVFLRGQVVGHEMMRGRGGEVWRMGTARLTWGCIRVGTGVAGREYGVKKWMDIEFIIRYFKKKS